MIVSLHSTKYIGHNLNKMLCSLNFTVRLKSTKFALLNIRPWLTMPTEVIYSVKYYNK